MVTLREDCVSKVMRGITTIEELMRATHAEA
jgi:type II secretory ATPase GspE/PulE/Tfp pilus assembly ATPase PilB-like protein